MCNFWLDLCKQFFSVFPPNWKERGKTNNIQHRFSFILSTTLVTTLLFLSHPSWKRILNPPINSINSHHQIRLWIMHAYHHHFPLSYFPSPTLIHRIHSAFFACSLKFGAVPWLFTFPFSRSTAHRAAPTVFVKAKKIEASGTSSSKTVAMPKL